MNLKRSAGSHGAALAFAAALCLLAPVPGGAARIYVNAGAAGANNGSSWPDAYTDLHTALSTATAGDTIWVGSGTYKPTTGADRTASFSLKNGVVLFGGFGGEEAEPADRNLRAHRTILSGEIGALSNEDNSYHVVGAQNVDSTAVIDGFVVRDGNASGGSPNDRGGGLIALTGSPTVRNVSFEKNSAVWGGGMSLGGGRAKISNVGFASNFAAFGGGLYTYNSGREVITNASFTADSVQWQGAAIYNIGSRPQIVNAIVWANHGITQIINLGGGVATFSHCIVQGSGGSAAWNPVFGTDGGNNLDVDPLLWSVSNGDFHLRPGSPAIDAGDNNAAELLPMDIDGDSRVVGGGVDIGADELDNPTGIRGEAISPPTRINSVYPNPFNPTVTIFFELDRRIEVRVAVYDVRGRLVRVLDRGEMSPGPHRALWDATNSTGGKVSSGVYFMEVQSYSWRDYRKVILVK
jgi:hypothetical protein